MSLKLVDRNLEAAVLAENLCISLLKIAVQPERRAFANTSDQELNMFPRHVLRLRAEDDRIPEIAAADETKVNDLDGALIHPHLEAFHAAEVIAQRHCKREHLLIVSSRKMADRVGILDLDIVADIHDLFVFAALDHINCRRRHQKILTRSETARNHLDGHIRVIQHVDRKKLLRIARLDRAAELAVDLLVRHTDKRGAVPAEMIDDITPVFNDSGKGLLQLTDTVGDTFAEASYTALVLGGGVWT